jgi:glycosyltransferase involved in cell wall biosynthesis
VLDVIPLVGLLAAEVAEAAAGKGGVPPAGDELLEAAGDASDAPTAIAAIHALARLPGAAIDDALAGILAGGGWRAPHVAWSLADRAPAQQLIDPLVALLEDGRLGGMLAQQTLARWAAVAPRAIWTALERHLGLAGGAAARGRLVETLGLVAPVGSADVTEALLARIAFDEDEQHEARVAAIAALGDRPGAAARALVALVASDGPLADVARLALLDHRLATAPAAGPAGGLHVAQVHLGGQLDRAMAHAGQGSTGGIATLLVQLGDALVADGRVEAVTTIGRGTARDAAASLGLSMDPHAVLAAPLGRHEDAAFAGEWPALVAAERAIRRIVARRSPTLLHLRMADVGSLAASRIARRAGMPTVFTLAPDPHAVIAEMERSGELDRASFGPADAAGALWFRSLLVRHLAESAQQIALFPRSDLEARLRDLLRIDIGADPRRYHVVPEGIDPQPVRAARNEIARLASPAVVADLRAAVDALGVGRRGLPLVVSVGRLADVKGMARLVEAFAAEPGLRRRANLVIVGGDLANPTPEERAEIDRIEAVLAPYPEMAEALVMLGHRPHDDVLRVLAAAEAGLGSTIGPGGAYACASRKEEFGLALVEALAAGLPVVAPRAGGPPSYVEDGVTGRLVDTLDPRALAAAIHDALDLAGRPGRAEHARNLVEERFTIRSMAETLVPAYAAASRSSTGVPA